MSQNDLQKLIADCVSGEISPDQHEALQQILKDDPAARAAYRERVDMEAALCTWASEGATVPEVPEPPQTPLRIVRTVYTAIALAASIALLVVAWHWWPARTGSQQIVQNSPANVDRAMQIGTVLQQSNGVWPDSKEVTTGSRFSTGEMSLDSGVVLLRFDSGTDLVVEGPAQLLAVSSNTAELQRGRVVVRVNDVSDGFTLRTPEARIIDEGTEYAVSIDAIATEVHVFDGSIVWQPVTKAGTEAEQRISAGEARRFARKGTGSGARVPLAMRQFVRQIEAGVQGDAQGALLAYDGFENIAGRLQRGRSGFGWAEGWRFSGHRQGMSGAVVEAPSEKVFGLTRIGRRMLRLEGGDSLWRDLDAPLKMTPGEVYYVSFIAQRREQSKDGDQSLQLSLGAAEMRRRHARQDEFAFGLTSEGFPYLKCGGRITRSAPAIENTRPYLVVAKIVVIAGGLAETYLRIYSASETVDPYEPPAWTIAGRPGAHDATVLRLSITAGATAQFDLDEVRIGTTWQSVTASPASD
jgi:hypothetical protein